MKLLHLMHKIVDSIGLWHERLGHVNFSYIKKIRESSLLSKKNLSNDKCEMCVEAKSIKKTCKQILNREAEPLSLIHSDLSDLKQTMTRGGKMYYITSIDDYSRYMKVYLLRNKDDAGKVLKLKLKINLIKGSSD